MAERAGTELDKTNEVNASIEDVLSSASCEPGPDVCRGISDRTERPGDLIPVLQSVQARLGYLPPATFAKVARHLNTPESAVYGVATFYAQFHLTPQGRHKIKVCCGTACHVRGSGKIMSAVEKRLGIGAGETTSDLAFSLERVACFGSCALAPVVVVDEKVHGRMTPKKMLKAMEDIA